MNRAEYVFRSMVTNLSGVELIFSTDKLITIKLYSVNRTAIQDVSLTRDEAKWLVGILKEDTPGFHTFSRPVNQLCSRRITAVIPFKQTKQVNAFMGSKNSIDLSVDGAGSLTILVCQTDEWIDALEFIIELGDLDWFSDLSETLAGIYYVTKNDSRFYQQKLILALGFSLNEEIEYRSSALKKIESFEDSVAWDIPEGARETGLAEKMKMLQIAESRVEPADDSF